MSVGFLTTSTKKIALNPTAFAIVSSGTAPSIDLYRSRLIELTGDASRVSKYAQNGQKRYARYLALARAEALIGNTVGAESYYQHAEHYFRSMNSDQRVER